MNWIILYVDIRQYPSLRQQVQSLVCTHDQHNTAWFTLADISDSAVPTSSEKEQMMQPYKCILVALNLSDLDVTTVRYAGMISRMAESERIYFAHVAESLRVPPSLRDLYPELVEPAEDAIEAEMRHVVMEHFDGWPDSQSRYIIARGSPIAELLRRAVQHNVDLIVVGNTSDKPDAGALPEKLARKAPCSVLIVREGSEPRIKRILVPVDFSRDSADALQAAAAIARTVGGCTTNSLHVFDVPPIYAKIGRTYEEFAGIIEDRVAEEYNHFVKDLDLGGVTPEPIFVADERPSKAIIKRCEEVPLDLLVMGARGRSDVTAILLGSATERVLRKTQVPLLVVRKKGGVAGFLEMLLGS